MAHDNDHAGLALITGASSGIGKELATIHASRGGDVILVARSQDKLDALAAELSEAYGIEAITIAADLTDPDAPRAIFEQVSARGRDIDVLINNAGFGGRGKFHERAWTDDLAMIQLNVVALTALARLFLPGMVARNRGRILNVSSTAALLPGPLQAVYYATKAYVTSFSNAVAEELHDTEVTVTALMPGATETEFARVSGMDKTSLFAKTASARDVAQAGYDAMLAGKLDVIAGVTFAQKMMMGMAPMMPKKMLLKQVRQMQEV